MRERAVTPAGAVPTGRVPAPEAALTGEARSSVVPTGAGAGGGAESHARGLRAARATRAAAAFCTDTGGMMAPVCAVAPPPFEAPRLRALDAAPLRVLVAPVREGR